MISINDVLRIEHELIRISSADLLSGGDDKTIADIGLYIAGISHMAEEMIVEIKEEEEDKCSI